MDNISCMVKTYFQVSEIELYKLFNIHFNHTLTNNITNVLYEDIQESGDFIIISVNNEEFKCHKCLLTCHKVFKEIIFNKDNKACSNNRWETEWNNIEVKTFINLLYGILQCNNNIEVGILLKFNDMFNINSIAGKLDEFISNILLMQTITEYPQRTIYKFEKRYFDKIKQIIPINIIKKHTIRKALGVELQNTDDIMNAFFE